MAGFGVAIALIPVNTVVGKFQSKRREALLKATDKRVKMISEVIMGMKAIKLYAWESAYLDAIQKARLQEQERVRSVQLLACLSDVIFASTTVLVAMVALVTYVALGNSLTASVAFPALAFFDLMEFPLYMLPVQIMDIINASVALKRVQNFVDAEELKVPLQLPAARGGEDAITFNDGCFAWDAQLSLTPILHGINLTVPSRQLVMVVGEVASGKSSLLAAMLSEMHSLSGSVTIRGRVAYTSQDPWIQNGTVEANIVMGLPMDVQRYRQVLQACALEDDLRMLPAHDQTEIGEKGVNLSGGQKHRVALARACYAGADVYLLDDPLSAVDATVGSHLMNACVKQFLSDKTRVLVTHQLQFLEHADLVVVMGQGTISAVGTYRELTARGINFTDARMVVQKREESNGSNHVDKSSEGGRDEDWSEGATHDSPFHKGGAAAGQLVQSEDRSVGSVRRSVYTSYLRGWGPALWVPIGYGIASVLEGTLDTGQNFWLSLWSRWTEAAATSGARVNDTFCVAVYFALGVGIMTLHGVRGVALVFATIRASSTLHDGLVHKVLRLPMSFFDTQPSGRLLNRFTKDVENCDVVLAETLSMFVMCIMWVGFAFLVVVLVTRGAILLAAVPLLLLYQHFQGYYLATSRELKRLNSVALSPIFSHFGETLSGLLTVRAFRWQPLLAAKDESLLELSNRAYWPSMVANRWLSIRLEGMGQVLVFVTAMVVALWVRDGGLAGLALTSALNLISLLTWTTRQGAELELSMNSVERLLEYHKYDSEKPAIIKGNRPAPSWPREGQIDVRDLTVSYRPELPPVLKGLSFHVNSHEKVGVCGRTGSGKSTLMMVLYRIIEPQSGSIKIDGIEVTTIGLYDLRSRLSLVPQDPVIFTGTVRSNLDPFGSAGTDLALWECLRQVGLEATVKSMDGGLDASLSEGGGNLSVGQRQLLCMARALLRKCSILLMDEATSNIDNDTDRIIQTTIRSALRDCTVITIAHRLHTILDSDRILVLDSGKIAEYAAPQELLSRKGGIFQQLVADARASSAHANL